MDGLSQNVQFNPNQNSGSCDFTILDDTTPEANETFAVDLIVSIGSGTVVSPSVAYLTILANDDAFGIIGFNEVGTCRECTGVHLLFIILTNLLMSRLYLSVRVFSFLTNWKLIHHLCETWNVHECLYGIQFLNNYFSLFVCVVVQNVIGLSGI